MELVRIQSLAIGILATSLISGAATWVYTVSTMITRDSASRMIKIESPYNKDKQDIYNRLNSTQKRQESVEKRLAQVEITSAQLDFIVKILSEIKDRISKVEDLQRKEY